MCVCVLEMINLVDVLERRLEYGRRREVDV